MIDCLGAAAGAINNVDHRYHYSYTSRVTLIKNIKAFIGKQISIPRNINNYEKPRNFKLLLTTISATSTFLTQMVFIQTLSSNGYKFIFVCGHQMMIDQHWLHNFVFVVFRRSCHVFLFGQYQWDCQRNFYSWPAYLDPL